jgi:glycosyltransferase involved in cell wall biosynthesis
MSRRVCFIRHSYYPSELNVKREAEALVKEGYQVSVICLRDDGEAPFERVGEVEVHRLPVKHKRGKIFRYLIEYNLFFILASLKLLFMHLDDRFDAIQINTMPDYLVYAALGPKLMGAKVVLHMHEPVPELFGTMFPQSHLGFFVTLTRWGEKMSLAFADRVLTVTREMRDNMGRRGADMDKITVIVNVPDDEMFRLELYEDAAKEVAEMRKEDRRRGVYRILTHGAIEERYGPTTIVRAVAKLKERIPGIEFRLLGKGSYLDEVLRLASELSVSDEVHYLGFLEFDHMVRELLAADVCIVPMLKNPYSVLVHTNKMYEYMALEKPVVATRLDSTASYFPDDAVLYYESGDDADLADKIYAVYSRPEEAAARVEKASEIYETYRWERERRKYVGVYASILGDAESPATPSPPSPPTSPARSD